MHAFTVSDGVKSSLESFRSVFMVNVDVINYHMTLSVANVYGKFLMFHTSGTTFHCKPIPVSCFAVQWIPFNVS